MAKMKMKGLPLKQIFFNHFEKMLFGICALLSIWMLTQNQWSWLTEQPAQLEEKAAKAAKLLTESQWPEDEKKKLSINDYQEQARKIPQPVNGEQYAITETLFWPLNPKKVPASEPAWYPVEDLIVSADRAILALKNPAAAAPVAPVTPDPDKKPDQPKTETPSTLPGLGEISTGPAAGPNPQGGQLAASINAQDLSAAFNGNINRSAISRAFGGRGRGGRRGDDDEEDADAARARAGAAAGAGQVAATTRVRGDDGQGYRYVAIRGIYPWKKQLAELINTKTFNDLNEAQNPEKFSLVDFQIQRREAIPGIDPWGGEWENVDVQKVQKFLMEQAFDFDPDPVDPIDTDPAITMPIPMRAFGGWPVKQVTHPRIKTLSMKALEESLEQQKKMMESTEALQKEEESSRKKKGFSGLVRDARSVQSYQAAQTSGEEGDDNDDRKGRGGRRGGRDGGGGGLAALGSMTGGISPMMRPTTPGTTVHAYIGSDNLLFRFFDLNVQPGRTYQYRVRIVVTNPNFGKTLADVMEPYVIEGEIRETPWSKPSTPVEIPSDYDVFVSQIRDSQEANVSDSFGIFHVYEWEQKIGTFILGTGKVNYGDMITFTVPTKVLRLHKKTAERENIEFNTSDVLLDGFVAPQLKQNEHPDLEVPNHSSERSLDGLLLDEAVVMNQFGEIDVMDPYSRKEDWEAAKKANEATFALADFLKKESAAATGGAEGNPLSRNSKKRGRRD